MFTATSNREGGGGGLRWRGRTIYADTNPAPNGLEAGLADSPSSSVPSFNSLGPCLIWIWLLTWELQVTHLEFWRSGHLLKKRVSSVAKLLSLFFFLLPHCRWLTPENRPKKHGYNAHRNKSYGEMRPAAVKISQIESSAFPLRWLTAAASPFPVMPQTVVGQEGVVFSRSRRGGQPSTCAHIFFFFFLPSPQ